MGQNYIIHASTSSKITHPIAKGISKLEKSEMRTDFTSGIFYFFKLFHSKKENIFSNSLRRLNPCLSTKIWEYVMCAVKQY